MICYVHGSERAMKVWSGTDRHCDKPNIQRSEGINLSCLEFSSFMLFLIFLRCQVSDAIPAIPCGSLPRGPVFGLENMLSPTAL